MKVALAQINTTVGDIAGNIVKIRSQIEEAKHAGARLVVFPELALTGYPPMDLLFKSSFIKANLDALENLTKSIDGIGVIVGFVDVNKGESGRPLHNAVAYIDEREIKAVQYKTLLPTYDVFDEDRYFEPALTYAVPICEGFKIGLSICEDIWVSEDLFPKSRYRVDPVDNISSHRPDLLINVSASPFSIGKRDLRFELVKNQALRHGLPVLYVNQVGGNDQLVFDGQSLAVDGRGILIAQGAAFEEDMLFVEVERQRDGRVDLTGALIQKPRSGVAEVYSALVLGTRDYMKKCGFRRAVVGLSGGIDSALTCAIACAAVGPENVLGVAMPSPHSSEHSVADAKSLAENLGIEFNLIEIEKGMYAFDQMLAERFDGKDADVTEENIQARLRGVTLMAISNKLGHLVLTTGNKSELAVGYCTLYGDMCGGLAVISDVPKMMVYAVSKYINESAGREIIPISTIEKAPSAELRPGQFDQDSLPPYEVLDSIIHEYVEERKTFQEIVKLGYSSEVVADVLNRIDRNEYKRKQAAPGLKVTAKAFGLGWRMPIAQRFTEIASAASKVV